MEMKKKSLQVEGMTGAGCELRIQEALHNLRGMKKVSAHYPIQAIFIEYDTQRLNWRQLDYQLRRHGFQRIETTDRVTFRIPGAGCVATMEEIRACFSTKPWIENVQISPDDCTVAVSFDSRAWTAREILRLIAGVGYQA